MASKAPAKAKATAKSKSKKGSKTTSATAGFTAAQYSAYQKASKAAIQSAQLHHNASTLQARRLQAATKTRSKLSSKGAEAMAARIKAHAIRQTYLQTVQAKESKSLSVAAAHRLFKAQSVATQKQFAYSGEAIHNRTTTLQTLTNNQALSKEAQLSEKARATAKKTAAKKKLIKKPVGTKKATKVTKKVKKVSPYAAIGRRAGLAAAAKVRVPSGVSSKTRTAGGHMNHLTLPNTSWITAGNELEQQNCTAVALANHLLYHTGHRITDTEVDMLAAYHRWDLAGALRMIDQYSVWPHVGLSEYGQVAPADAKPGMVVGFEVVVEGKTVDHCGLLLEDNKVVSWGEAVPLPSVIDEVWEVEWTVTRTT